MADHDPSYKLLFSHAAMVEDLLRGFVHEEWVEQLDFGSLEKVSGSFVAEDLRERENDVIWRVRWGEEWVYVYLLLEFQSTVDRYMALRIMAYVALLYQDLLRQKKLTREGLLPPVVPIVLYNGGARWTAAEEVADLIHPVPGKLGRYRPKLRYLLVDEGRYDEAELSQSRNLVAALFRLEFSREPAVIGEVLGAVAEWVQSPEQASLRRALTTWVVRVLKLGQIPGVELEQLNDLSEVKAMLAERVKDWTQGWKEEGIQEGLRRGRQEGRREESALLLRRLLTRRFGAVPAWAESHLNEADLETLEQWMERILTAATVEDVLRIGNA